MRCKYSKDIFSLLNGENENDELMEHIERCPECRGILEHYLQESQDALKEGEGIVFDCESSDFKKHIYKFNRGLSRIVVFTLIGLILGWLSNRYRVDTCIVTKILEGILYKISDTTYRCLYEPTHLYQGEIYFPQAGAVAFLAERITPVLIGGAVYGSIGYFTGSRRIFTWKKYLYFISMWVGIIVLWIGSMFVANEWSLKKNDQLQNVNGFEIFVNHEWGYYAREDTAIYECNNSAIYKLLREALGDTEDLEIMNKKTVIASEDEAKVIIYMGVKRKNTTKVNWKEKYMVLESGKVVKIPDEFAQYIEDFYNSTGVFKEEQGRKNVKISR